MQTVNFRRLLTLSTIVSFYCFVCYSLWILTRSVAYAPAGRSLKDPKTTCMTCTPQQTTELTCVICDKRKGLEQFAKAQRRHPTKARCKKCVEFHLAHEADDTPPDSDDYAESDSFSVCYLSLAPIIGTKDLRAAKGL